MPGALSSIPYNPHVYDDPKRNDPLLKSPGSVKAGAKQLLGHLWKNRPSLATIAKHVLPLVVPGLASLAD